MCTFRVLTLLGGYVLSVCLFISWGRSIDQWNRSCYEITILNTEIKAPTPPPQSGDSKSPSLGPSFPGPELSGSDSSPIVEEALKETVLPEIGPTKKIKWPQEVWMMHVVYMDEADHNYEVAQLRSDPVFVFRAHLGSKDPTIPEQKEYNYLLGVQYAQDYRHSRDSGERAKADEAKRDSIKYFQQAAQLGEPHAQYRLGVMYAFGLDGLKQDDNKGVHWIKAAAQLGHRAAKVAYEEDIKPQLQKS